MGGARLLQAQLGVFFSYNRQWRPRPESRPLSKACAAAAKQSECLSSSGTDAACRSTAESRARGAGVAQLVKNSTLFFFF